MMLHQTGGSTPCGSQAPDHETSKSRVSSCSADIFRRKSYPPIDLEWAFGYDKSVRNGVHSLTQTIEGAKAVFFPASNTGVVHIYHADDEDASAKAAQLLLRGHTNRISAVAVSEDKALIATGDAGQGSLLIIWSASRAKHLKKFENPHPMGVCSVDFTPDANFVATLSALIPEKYIAGKTSLRQTDSHASAGHEELSNKNDPGASFFDVDNSLTEMYQGVAIWNWKDTGQVDQQFSCFGLMLTSVGAQHEIRFNPWDVNELLTSGRRRVLFWYWRFEDVSFHFYSPALQPKLFKQKIGDITTSAFLPRSTKAITGTTDGDIVIWNLSLIVDGPDERRAVSILRLRNACVTSIKTFEDKWIVMRLVRCFEDLGLGQIRCLSFVENAGCKSCSPLPHLEDHPSLSKKGTIMRQHDWIADAQRLPTLLVSTSKARIAEVVPIGHDDNEKREVSVVFDGLDAVPTTLLVHPHEPILVVAGVTGFLRLWNSDSHFVLGNIWFDKLSATTAAFSPAGTSLAVGFCNGSLKIFEFRAAEALSMRCTEVGGANCLVELFSSKESREAVTHCTFSADSAHLAVAYADNVVCLFRFDSRLGSPQLAPEWTYAGKHHSHYRSICGLSFAQASGGPPCSESSPPGLATTAAVAIAGASQSFASRPMQAHLPIASPQLYAKGYPRLFSVGEDRRLVEYDVPNSFEHTGLLQRRWCTVEQRAVPTGCLALPSARCCRLQDDVTDVQVIVYSNNGKAKIWSGNSMACVKTNAGGCVVRVWVDRCSPVLLVACKENILGLRQLPLHGSPCRGLSVVAHAGPVVALATSAPINGYTPVFTCGRDDCTVFQWRINHSECFKAMQAGPSGAQSFLELIPGGKHGTFHRTAKEFFNYSQLRSQGEHTTRTRRLDGSVPIEELPNLLCALGENPTLLELKNIFSECSSNELVMQNQPVAGHLLPCLDTSGKGIAFERFLTLYVNQRSSLSFRYCDVVQAFKQLAKGTDPRGISSDKLTHLLLTKGEPLDQAELAHCLQVLTGSNSLDGLTPDGNMTGDFFARRVLQMEYPVETPSAGH
ncbi:hypothetical protein Esti_006119 [Eimeria stiedai]